MGAPGFLKKLAPGAGGNASPDDVPRLKDLGWSDKLMALSFILNGDNASAMQIPMLAAQRAQQARAKTARHDLDGYLSGEGVSRVTRSELPAITDPGDDLPKLSAPAGPDLGRLNLGDGVDALPKLPALDFKVPQYGVAKEGGRTGSLNMADAIRPLLAARAAGVDIKTDIDLIDKARPDIGYERGVRYDKRDLGSAPAEIAELEKGQRRVYDRYTGKLSGIENIDGYVQSVAELEAAKTTASEGAKAGFDIEEYTDANGVPQRMTRRQAVGELDGLPMLPPGGASPGLPQRTPGARPAAARPNIATGQSAADKALAEARAKTVAEREALAPKARATMETLDRKSDFILDTLRRAKVQATGGLGGAAGYNSLLSGIPETAAFDLRATLDTIEAAIGFDELQQMRDNSPTGGAVGNLTERELSLLSALRGSLKAGQSPEQLQRNIDRAAGELEKITKERRAAFNSAYSGSPGAPAARAPAARPSLADIDAELARRGAK